MSRLDAMKGAGEGAWSLAKHVMGGAAIGGAVNTAAYASGGSLTNSQSAGQAFMSGAGWGAAIGGGFGAMNLRGKAAASVIDNVGPSKMQKAANSVGVASGNIVHAAGDLATSVYGGVKSFATGRGGSAVRRAKEERLIKQANRIMGRNQKSFDRMDSFINRRNVGSSIGNRMSRADKSLNNDYQAFLDNA